MNLFLFYSGKLCNRGYREKKKKTMAGKSSLIIGEGYWKEYLDNTWSTSFATLNIFAHSHEPWHLKSSLRGDYNWNALAQNKKRL